MKVCPGCHSACDGNDWICPRCHFSVPRVGGFLAFAPEMAEGSSGFQPQYFRELADLEARNFWFRARNRLIIWAMRRHFPDASNFLEVGCGTGYVLSGIAEALPSLRLYGSEIFSEGLGFAADRVRRAEFFQMDARRIPFASEFDVVGAFDVLEHIDDDEAVLAQMHEATTRDGGIIVTVPQHAFLWSRQDEYACHVRRYDARDLRDKVRRAGFVVERATSFVTLLLPLMLLSRWRKHKSVGRFDALSELRISGIANTVLEAVLGVERALIRTGLAFPLGGSLLLVARKV